MKEFEETHREKVAPELPTQTIQLTPLDIFYICSDTFMDWPMFFGYDIDGARLLESLKKLVEKYPVLCGRVQPDPDLRYVIQIDASKDDAHGFPFVEGTSDMSVAAAILHHSQLKAESAVFPCQPKMPFFMESIDIEPLLRGEEPLFKVKLTHFTDGCVLNVTIGHLVVDGQRFVEIYRDISRAYRGEEIPDRDHDRSYIWPDGLAKCYSFLGDDVAKLPRKASPIVNRFPRESFPNQSCQTEILYFSKDVLEEMKAAAKPFLSSNAFVSANDVLVAFMWMLKCEMAAPNKNVIQADEMPVTNTMCGMAIEFVKNGITVVPENYCGNAVLSQPFTTEGMDFEGKSFQEMLAILSEIVRNTVKMTQDPSFVANMILIFYSIIASGELPTYKTKHSGALSSMVKTPISEIDFGKGSPVFAHITPVTPLLAELMKAGPPPGKMDGVLVQAVFLESELEALKESAVIKHCAPGMKQLYALSLDEIKAMLDVEK